MIENTIAVITYIYDDGVDVYLEYATDVHCTYKLE